MAPTRAKQAVKLTPKAKPDPHAKTWEMYRQVALEVTRKAVERYEAAKADSEAAYAEAAAAHDLLPPYAELGPNGGVLPKSPEQDAISSNVEHFERWPRFALWHLYDAEQYLLKAILNFGGGRMVDRARPVGLPPRGILCNGTLYIATPIDPDDPPDEQRMVLHSISLTSIVDINQTFVNCDESHVTLAELFGVEGGQS